MAKWMCLFLILCSSPCRAVISDNLTVGSAKALSLGNAVTADPPGIDAIHFNPAGLTALKGRQVQSKLVSGSFGVTLKLGEYNAERAAFLAEKKASGAFSDNFFDDEAYNTTSHTEGASLMVPLHGATDLPLLFFPLGGVAYTAPESDFTFATNIYTPMAIGFYRSKQDTGRFIGERFAFTLMTYFSPSVAYRFSDTVSVGATITFNYAGSAIDMPFRSPNSALVTIAELQNQVCADPADNNLCSTTLGFYDPLGELSYEVEDPLTFGFNAGVLWQPVERLTLGVVYQAAVPMKMEGDFVWKNGASWEALVNPFGVTQPIPDVTHGKARLNMDMPEHYAFGASLKITPKLKANVDYKFTGWSAWDSIPLQFSEPIDYMRVAGTLQPALASEKSVKFPLGLKDSWNYAAGFAYQYSDQLTLRCGLEDRPSSLPGDAQTPLLPIGDGTLYGLGFGYQRDNASVLEMTLGYFASDVHMPGGSSALGNSTDPAKVIYNPYAGQDIDAAVRAYLLEASYRTAF